MYCNPNQNKDTIIEGFFCKNEQIASKIHMEIRRIQNSKTILKENKIGGFILPDIKTYYEITVIKTREVLV